MHYDVPDQAVITFVVIPPDQNMDDRETLERTVQRWTDEYGSGVRRFKNALIWVVPDSMTGLEKEARARRTGFPRPESPRPRDG